jgi:CheY-like chemotaxis protein
MLVVADDDDVFRETAKDFFESHRYLVLPARTGTEALARMRGIGAPTIALVDLVMPNIDGWDLIRTMRADPELARIPVIVLSSAIEPAVEGATAILRKPYSLVSLLALVDQLLPSPSP